MERDTYSRFRRDERSIRKLVASFHREAGVGENDNVTFEQFRIWALSNPAVLICFTGLTRSIQRVLDQRKAKSAASVGETEERDAFRCRLSRAACYSVLMSKMPHVL